MGYRKRAGGGRRDESEKAIVDALEACGVRVWKLGGTGNPDLLCLCRGVYTPLEVKTNKGRITVNQTTIPWPVVRDPLHAFLALGIQMNPKDWPDVPRPPTR